MKTTEEIFEHHFEKMRHGLFRGSLDYYLQTGHLSGSMLLEVRAMFQSFAQQFKELPPHERVNGFCVTPNSKCSMNYCDENGCMDRKRNLSEPLKELPPSEPVGENNKIDFFCQCENSVPNQANSSICENCRKVRLTEPEPYYPLLTKLSFGEPDYKKIAENQLEKIKELNALVEHRDQQIKDLKDRFKNFDSSPF